MRRSSILTALLVGAAVVAAAPAPAAATGYCSPSGDQCYSAKRVEGQVRLQYSTFSFRGKLRTCVTAPGGRTDCRTFTLRVRNGVSSIDVRWSAHFPRRGAGTYRVRFAGVDAGNELGRAVTFRLAG